MNYLLVHVSGILEFTQTISQLRATGYTFTTNFLQDWDDEGVKYDGSWGCLRFAGPLPPIRLFAAPAVEYRYNPDTQQWDEDGRSIIDQGHIVALYEFFKTMEGGQ